jgi:leucyl/phenylalanyl-tRNA--protein transferase
MAFRVHLIAATDPPDSFPDPAEAGIALGYPDGLIAIGGDLSPARLLAAYRRGLFPWFNDDQPILWWSPEPRAVIRPENFHVSRSLARTLRSGDWEFSLNQSFDKVIAGCAENRGEYGTWITAEMVEAYRAMHELGYAHSLESWFHGELAGGIYGIRLGNIFFGESMYSSVTGGSKVAISGLIQLCLDTGISLLDCQLASAHLATLGMEEITRNDFLAILETEIAGASACPNWVLPRSPAAPLADLRRPAYHSSC